MALRAGSGARGLRAGEGARPTVIGMAEAEAGGSGGMVLRAGSGARGLTRTSLTADTS